MFEFSLPSIGFTSPFFAAAPTMHDSGSSTDDNEPERPLTPQSTYASQAAAHGDSPHRIPAFEFEEVSLHAVSKAEKSERQVSPVVAASSVKGAPPSVPMTLVTSRPLSAGDFGSTAMPGEGSTTTRVRQRISREMIRETVQQRIAEGSLGRKGSIIDPTSTITSDQPRVDKDLPPPPSDSIPMSKAHTTDSASRSSDERPKMRARSQTQSAHQVLMATERDGMIAEPKSALDRLIQIAGPSVPRVVSSSSIMPVSILQKSKEHTLLPSVALHSPSGGDGMAAREQAINAKRREKEGRTASSTSGASGNTVKGRRRSLSVSDAGDGEAVSK